MAATNPTPQVTDFSRDILGRYICNGMDEANPSVHPFDVVIIGGGSFGLAMAQHLMAQDHTRSRRILVLEAGPMALPEHVQNLPLPGLSVGDATSLADLRKAGLDNGQPRKEVWGLSWHSDTPFPGLAYCIGGRSLFWGGWSPQLLDAETQTWPPSVINDLVSRYFDEAAEQIGTDVTNDFISGPLHEALRTRLLEGIQNGKIMGAIPPAKLPSHLKDVPPGLEEASKLEAPLAIQSHTEPGLFPVNKFSSVQLLMKAARTAWGESGGDDTKKRLMIVPKCHVKRLVTASNLTAEGLVSVVGIDTNQGYVPLPHGGEVILAAGTIENARLALLSFPGLPSHGRMGQNLMAHLRSNLVVRIPRASLPAGLPETLESSALFVKGQHRFMDGSQAHFHLQITASGLGPADVDAETSLFRKIPDIDTFNHFRTSSTSHVVISIRGIGEMQPHNPNSFVRLDPETDEFGIPRAFVSIADPRHDVPGSPQTVKDRELWDAMDQAAMDTAKVFAHGQPFDTLGHNRDGLGTTHHETGTLWMGDDPATSVTDTHARLHDVANVRVAGPALFPTIGSPNPMLTGVALARRLADTLCPPLLLPEKGFRYLFDGTPDSLQGWKMAGQGSFRVQHSALVAQPGGDLGLLWYTGEAFSDFNLRLQIQLDAVNDNSGVFLRFRNPELPVPDHTKSGVSWSYANQAFVGVNTGFEVQIDELGAPDGAAMHRTGAIYDVPLGKVSGTQDYTPGPILLPGQWYDLEIQVISDNYMVRINGQRITTFMNTDPFRGKSRDKDPESGFIGLQTHSGAVAFRNIRICHGPALTQVMAASAKTAAAALVAGAAPKPTVV